MASLQVAGCLAAGFLLTSCALSSTSAISPSHPASIPGRAVLVFSVAVERPQPFDRASVQLDQYDLTKQQITGGCLSFERVIGEAMPTRPGVRRYFAFSAPAGAYTFSRFNTAVLDGPSRAFLAPAGQVTYIGDFTYTVAQLGPPVGRDMPHMPNNRRVTLTIDLPTAEQVTGVKLAPAEVVDVTRPRAFICTP